jgi:hypothetical protein
VISHVKVADIDVVSMAGCRIVWLAFKVAGIASMCMIHRTYPYEACMYGGLRDIFRNNTIDIFIRKRFEEDFSKTFVF